IILPTRCTSWKMFSYTNYRNSSNNILNSTSSAFYIEATLNNQYAQGNSSPYFLKVPANYVIVNQPFSYNNNVLDPNGDSVVTEVVNPLTGVTACSDVAASAAMFSGFTTIYNPFSTNNSFSLNPNTDVFNFTSTQVGNHV